MANNGTQIRGQQFQICTTPQPSDLTAVQFAALTYVDICCLQETPDFSVEANILTENCIDGRRLVGVGADEASEMEVSFFYMADCPGQDALRALAMAKTNVPYAIRKVYSDGVPGVSTPTTVYARVIISGFTDNGGSLEDFQTHTVGGSVVQDPIFVKPVAL